MAVTNRSRRSIENACKIYQSGGINHRVRSPSLAAKLPIIVVLACRYASNDYWVSRVLLFCTIPATSLEETNARHLISGAERPEIRIVSKHPISDLRSAIVQLAHLFKHSCIQVGQNADVPIARDGLVHCNCAACTSYKVNTLSCMEMVNSEDATNHVTKDMTSEEEFSIDYGEKNPCR